MAKLQLRNGLTATVTRRAVDELNLEVGSKVYASFKATSPHVIPTPKN